MEDKTYSSLEEKMLDYEKRGLFNTDVNDDPPPRKIMPGEVDYLHKKLKTRIVCKMANHIGKSYFDKEIRKKNLVISNIIGMENYEKVQNMGVMITCNHFAIYDNYIIFKAIEKKLGKRRLWKVIKEGNYTSMTGFFGKILRGCNTLPLSSSMETMKEFMSAVDVLLKRGEKILIYPEQAMWPYYTKPRPLKNGAFKLAVRSNAPILPCFITMTDSGRKNENGETIYDNTLYILPPLYPDLSLNEKDRVNDLMQKNYDSWKEVYEQYYKKPLVYEK